MESGSRPSTRRDGLKAREIVASSGTSSSNGACWYERALGRPLPENAVPMTEKLLALTVSPASPWGPDPPGVPYAMLARLGLVDPPEFSGEG